jgi:prepilin-type processing-associated H-X9-DG protein/prepilin-type N-terminal cleavage/methylation domain-containing protein
MKTTRAEPRHPPGGGTGRPLGAFTLIELLVVIAMITILAAMLLPTLARSKLKTFGAIDLSNQRQLACGFEMYGGDHGEVVVPMQIPAGTTIYKAGGFWKGPSPEISSGMTPAQALAAALNGLVNDNALYKYCPNSAVYHCPGDTRYKYQSPGNGFAYDSYSKTQNVGGEDYNACWGAGATYTKISQITSPSMTFIFTEDADWRGYNEGTWIEIWSIGRPGSFVWDDPPALYHGNTSSFAFADGHAEHHKWSDSSIIAAGLNAAKGAPSSGFKGPTSGSDYSYVRDRYRHPNWN